MMSENENFMEMLKYCDDCQSFFLSLFFWSQMRMGVVERVTERAIHIRIPIFLQL